MAQLEVEHGPGWGSRLLRWLGGGIGPDSPAKDGREGIYPQSSSDEALEHGPNQVQQFLLWAHLSGHSSSRMNQDLPNPAAHEKSFSDPKKMDLTLISVDFQMDFSRMNGLLFEVRTFPPSLPPRQGTLVSDRSARARPALWSGGRTKKRGDSAGPVGAT